MHPFGTHFTFVPFAPFLVWFLVFFGGFILLARVGVFTPKHLNLRSKGIDLLLSGHPADAEKCYRAALDLGDQVPPSARVRLLVCLSDALFDQGRFPEAMQYLNHALQIGDPTGSAQGSMCDLLVAMKTDPERAIEMADEALQLTSTATHDPTLGTSWEHAKRILYEAKSLARKARALVLLDRDTEARQTLKRALDNLEASKEFLFHAMPESSFFGTVVLGHRPKNTRDLGIASTHWQIGLALEELGDPIAAVDQFRIVHNADRRGKYRNRAQQKLRGIRA